ncbi:cyclophilin-like fold protein [Streptomyces sp. NPDC020794]|uniref:cyclophilin-like fold protein n=1 Tax=unclassified Streptomyces TaxID=2593676 RepID=UPI0036E0B585
MTSLARAIPAALLLAMTACTEDTPSSSSSTPSASPASSSQGAASPPVPTPTQGRTTAMDIRLTMDGHRVDATLNDSATARDFAALLPLTLHLSDFHRTERIAGLPRRLTTADALAATAAKAGDLAYYAPWGNLALYYRDGGPDPDTGLVLLGRMADGDIKHLATATATKVTIEAAS